MPSTQGLVNILLVGDDSGVQVMLSKLDTALNPIAVATFLGAVVDPYIKRRAKERFASEGDDVVGTWVPLASATQAIRSQAGYGGAHPINKRTSELEDYITQSDKRIKEHLFGATYIYPGKEPVGELRTKVETAQSGKQWPQTPPRPVLGMNEKDLAFVLTALAFTIKGLP